MKPGVRGFFLEARDRGTDSGERPPTCETAQVEVSLNGKGSARIGHGSVLIAAITSCTNTSNPSVMLAAGLLAKKAVQRGLKVGGGGQVVPRPGHPRVVMRTT